MGGAGGGRDRVIVVKMSVVEGLLAGRSNYVEDNDWFG